MKRYFGRFLLISILAAVVSLVAQIWPPALLEGFIDTVAGGGSPADGLGDGGPATDASLNFPIGIVGVDTAGNIFIPDSFNNRVRRVDGDIVKCCGWRGQAAFS